MITSSLTIVSIFFPNLPLLGVSTDLTSGFFPINWILLTFLDCLKDLNLFISLISTWISSDLRIVLSIAKNSRSIIFLNFKYLKLSLFCETTFSFWGIPSIWILITLLLNLSSSLFLSLLWLSSIKFLLYLGSTEKLNSLFCFTFNILKTLGSLFSLSILLNFLIVLLISWLPFIPLILIFLNDLSILIPSNWYGSSLMAILVMSLNLVL